MCRDCKTPIAVRYSKATRPPCLRFRLWITNLFQVRQTRCIDNFGYNTYIHSRIQGCDLGNMSDQLDIVAVGEPANDGHCFKPYTFSNLQRCHFCASCLLGLLRQGLQCSSTSIIDFLFCWLIFLFVHTSAHST